MSTMLSWWLFRSLIGVEMLLLLLLSQLFWRYSTILWRFFLIVDLKCNHFFLPFLLVEYQENKGNNFLSKRKRRKEEEEEEEKNKKKKKCEQVKRKKKRNGENKNKYQ